MFLQQLSTEHANDMLKVLGGGVPAHYWCWHPRFLFLSLFPLYCVVDSYFFPLSRRQDVSLSGRGRPGLSDVSASSFPPTPHLLRSVLLKRLCVCVFSPWPECILFATFLNAFRLTLTSPPPLIKFHPPLCLPSACLRPSCSWISVLQNSKEEALTQAFKGDHHVGENNIVQELTKAILGEVKRMTGNDVCCDCGAPSESH